MNVIRSTVRLLVWVAAAVIAALLVLNAAYCWQGSLEEFPTDEQQDKVRVVTLALGFLLLMIEAGLIALAVWLRRQARAAPKASAAD
jgi:hypothetical protein